MAILARPTIHRRCRVRLTRAVSGSRACERTAPHRPGAERHDRGGICARNDGKSTAIMSAVHPAVPVLASGLVLRDDRRRDAAPFTHLEAPAFSPLTDLRTLLAGASGLRLPPAPTGRRRHPATVFGEWTDLLPQFLGVVGARIDLIR